MHTRTGVRWANLILDKTVFRGDEYFKGDVPDVLIPTPEHPGPIVDGAWTIQEMRIRGDMRTAQRWASLNSRSTESALDLIAPSASYLEGIEA